MDDDFWATQQGPAVGREGKRSARSTASSMFAALAEESDYARPPRPLGRQPSIRDFGARQPVVYADLTDSEDEEPLQLNRWYSLLKLTPQHPLPSSLPSAQTRSHNPPPEAKVQKPVKGKSKPDVFAGSPERAPKQWIESTKQSASSSGTGSPQASRLRESRQAARAPEVRVPVESDSDSDLDVPPPRSSKPRSGVPASPVRSPVRSPRSPGPRRAASPARGAGAPSRRPDTRPVPLGPLVACPMCQKRVPQAELDQHVQEELEEQDREEKQAQEDKDIAYAKQLSGASSRGSGSASSPDLVIVNVKPQRIPRKTVIQEQPGPSLPRKRKRRQTISSDDDEEDAEVEKPKRAKVRPDADTQHHGDHADSVFDFPAQASYSQEH